MKRPGVLAAAIVVVSINVWSWVDASRNRGEASGGTLELTERELRLPRAIGESTALALELEWTTPHEAWERRGMAAWLDGPKLLELGLDPELSDCATHDDGCESSQLTRPVFVVLELAEERPSPEESGETRLVAIDAGIDAARLREGYPDPSRHAIVRGLAGAFVQERSGPDDLLLETPRVRGYLEELRPRFLFVPRPYSRVLEDLTDERSTVEDLAQHGPRFAATVSWGRGHEPWIESTRLLDGGD